MQVPLTDVAAQKHGMVMVTVAYRRLFFKGGAPQASAHDILYPRRLVKITEARPNVRGSFVE